MSQAKTFTLSAYQEQAKSTRQYPLIISHALIYPLIGLAGEVGEVQNKVKKIFRDRDGKLTADDVADLGDELGDVLWYLAILATELDLDLGDIAQANAEKLASRRARGVIKGDGDKR